MWYARPSEYVWHDDSCQPHAVTQAEGGEQGDPLMPALFSLGQHPALEAVAAQLQPGEALYAFLDDVYAVVEPNRVRPVYDLLAHHLHETARIRLNSGKTRIWNKTGHQPPNTEDLGAATWVGDQSLPPEQQGITVLGAPIGSAEHIQSHLQQTSAQHTPPLQHLPYLDDLQASWLLLLYTASTRSNYLLRMVPPHLTTQFAQQHDASITACLAQLLETTNFPAAAIARAHLPLTAGGLGLPSAMLHATPAYWASWADALAVLHKQDPTVTDTLLHHLANPSEASSHIAAASQARTDLQDQGWDPPSWDELAAGQAPPHGHEEVGNGPVQPGWRRQAATPYHTTARAELYHTLDPPAQAMLDSQSGPFSGRAFTSIPYTPDATYPGPLFRLLLLRCLRLPLPLSDRICRCRRTVDPLGDHHSACPRTGVLRSRGGPLEIAAARVCREAGARVTMRTRITDLNIPAPCRLDERRIEVIANGLPLWNGAQLAVDTTLVAP